MSATYTKIMALLGFALMGASALGLSSRLTVDLGTEAIAETDTQVLTANCTEPTAAAYVPNVTYTIVPVVARATVTCTTTLSLANGINSDAGPSVTCTPNDRNGYFTLISGGPLMKMAGTQCVADSNYSQIQAHDSNDTNVAPLDVAIQPPDTTTWDSTKQVDTGTAAAKKMIYGSSGLVGPTRIDDGNDQDSFENGEIVVGGSGPNGGNKLVITQDIVDIATDGSTESMVMTFTTAGTP